MVGKEGATQRLKKATRLVGSYAMRALRADSWPVLPEVPYKGNEELFPLPVTNVNISFRYNEDGCVEKKCGSCGEWWPATRDFFYQGPIKGLASWCVDCKQIKVMENRRAHGIGRGWHKLDTTGTGELECTTCGIFKPLGDFIKGSDRNTLATCKLCQQEYTSRWYNKKRVNRPVSIRRLMEKYPESQEYRDLQLLYMEGFPWWEARTIVLLGFKLDSPAVLYLRRMRKEALERLESEHLGIHTRLEEVRNMYESGGFIVNGRMSPKALLEAITVDLTG